MVKTIVGGRLILAYESRRWQFITAGKHGSMRGNCGGRAKWEITALPQAHRKGAGSLPLVTHFLQQDHTSHTAPESAISWEASERMNALPYGEHFSFNHTKILKTTRRLLALPAKWWVLSGKVAGYKSNTQSLEAFSIYQWQTLKTKSREQSYSQMP